jgi:hypothetical protein
VLSDKNLLKLIKNKIENNTVLSDMNLLKLIKNKLRIISGDGKNSCCLNLHQEDEKQIVPNWGTVMKTNLPLGVKSEKLERDLQVRNVHIKGSKQYLKILIC